MAWNFRKRIKIAPGLTVNLGKRGTSFTFGKRGASINVGPRGTHANLGMPGTGLSLRERLDTPSKKQYSRAQIQQGPCAKLSTGQNICMGLGKDGN